MPQTKAPQPLTRGRPSGKGALQAIFGPGRNATKNPVVAAPEPGPSPTPTPAVARMEPAPATPKHSRPSAPEAAVVSAAAERTSVPEGSYLPTVQENNLPTPPAKMTAPSMSPGRGARLEKPSAGVRQPEKAAPEGGGRVLTLSNAELRAAAAELRRQRMKAREVEGMHLELLPGDRKQLERIGEFLKKHKRKIVRAQMIRLALAAFQEREGMAQLYDRLKHDNDGRLLHNRLKPAGSVIVRTNDAADT